ncbi:hypothetical protein Abr02nite_56320 [Paractinoplanes brasiliensis]|nr:hypothetical protein Abr02nite_56320 [Actinoplanes brasiliensis]
MAGTAATMIVGTTGAGGTAGTTATTTDGCPVRVERSLWGKSAQWRDGRRSGDRASGIPAGEGVGVVPGGTARVATTGVSATSGRRKARGVRNRRPGLSGALIGS